MGYRMAEEYRAPAQSRFIDLVSQSAKDYMRQKAQSSGRVADLMYRGGAAYGQGIGQGLQGLGQGIGTGIQRRKENEMAERRQSEEERANKATEDYRFKQLAQQDWAAMDAKDRLAEETRRFNQTMGQQKKEYADIRSDMEKKAKAAGLQKELLAAQEIQNLSPEQLSGMPFGNMQPVRMQDGTVMSPQQVLYAKRINDIAQKYGVSPEDLTGKIGEARRTSALNKITEQSLRTNTPQYQEINAVTQQARKTGQAINDLKNLAKQFKNTYPVGPTSSTRQKIEGELLNYMDQYDQAAANEYRSSLVAPGWQSPSGYMAGKVKSMIEDAKRKLQAQYSSLSAQQQQDPALKQAMATLDKIDRGVNVVTGKPRGQKPVGASFNPYMTGMPMQQQSPQNANPNAVPVNINFGPTFRKR